MFLQAPPRLSFRRQIVAHFSAEMNTQYLEFIEAGIRHAYRRRLDSESGTFMVCKLSRLATVTDASLAVTWVLPSFPPESSVSSTS
ncbi:hypothetical protein K438DRAFT_1950612 [Mycena galopus ATCC 62051]|nr:hypothetical protein K438DRAFT_1950612 [Mycena galopus ATCC 62051]